MKWLVAALVIWAVWKLLAKPRTRPLPRVAPSRPEWEALTLLEVEQGADAQTIRDAHRRKIAGAHPDRGGSADLTRELNAARDLLLRTRAAAEP